MALDVMQGTPNPLSPRPSPSRIGLAGALLTTRLLASLLYEVKPTDPLTLASGAALLLAVSALAGWIPARKAARISPLEAMR